MIKKHFALVFLALTFVLHAIADDKVTVEAKLDEFVTDLRATDYWFNPKGWNDRRIKAGHTYPDWLEGQLKALKKANKSGQAALKLLVEDGSKSEVDASVIVALQNAKKSIWSNWNWSWSGTVEPGVIENMKAWGEQINLLGEISDEISLGKVIYPKKIGYTSQDGYEYQLTIEYKRRVRSSK